MSAYAYQEAFSLVLALYEAGIAAGSDHAPVMVDLDLTAR